MQPQFSQSGRPAELAGRDARFEVRRDRPGDAREDALLGRSRRLRVDLDHALRHLDLRVALAQREERRHDLAPILGTQLLGRLLADLRRVEAEPDLAAVRLLLPELGELLEVPAALHQLARHRAVHDDLLPDDVLEDAVVGGRRAAHVVLGRQAVDRHDDRQAAESTPTRSESAARRSSRPARGARAPTAAAAARRARGSGPAARRRRSRRGAAGGCRRARARRR